MPYDDDDDDDSDEDIQQENERLLSINFRKENWEQKQINV